MSSNSYINLSHADLNIIIGLLPHERIHKQKIEIDLRLALASQDLWCCARDGDLDYSINYADIWKLVQFIAGYGQFYLLESFIYTLARILLSEKLPVENRASIHAMDCTVSKPEVLLNCIPQLQWSMSVDELQNRKQYLYCHSTDHSIRLTNPKGISHIKYLESTLNEQSIFDATENYSARLYTHSSKMVKLKLNSKQFLFVITGEWSIISSMGIKKIPSYTPIMSTLHPHQWIECKGPAGAILIEHRI
jgi:dihydroneopterin aldolase